MWLLLRFRASDALSLASGLAVILAGSLVAYWKARGYHY
jgi:hypothetical protein